MAEQKTDGHGQTQHQRLPQCIVDFRVVNQPAPHEGKTKTAYCGSNTPLSNLTGAVDDDGFTVRGNQVLIFQHFQNTTNGFTRAADDLTNFRRVILICIPSGWVMASGCFAEVQQRLGDTARHVEEGQLPTFSDVTCRRRAICEERRIRMSGFTRIS